MPGGCLLSFLLSIAGRGPIWPRQRLPWLHSVSRFGTGAPSSALLSRFAVNKEEVLSLISGGTISERAAHPFSPTRAGDTVPSRANAISARLFQAERTLMVEGCDFPRVEAFSFRWNYVFLRSEREAIGTEARAC